MAYILGALILWFIFGILVPRKEWREYYPVFLFAALLGTLCDLWGIVYGQWFYRGPTVGGLSLWSVVGMASAESGIFIGLYPVGKGWLTQILYLNGWALLNAFGEWLFVKNGWIGYQHWNSVRAFIFYLVFFGVVGLQEYAYNGTGRLRKG